MVRAVDKTLSCWCFQALYKIREPFTIYHLSVARKNCRYRYRE